MISSGSELLRLCKENKKKISKIALEHQLDEMDITKEELLKMLKDTYDVMKASASDVINNDKINPYKITGGNAKKILNYAKSGKSILGEEIVTAIARGFSTSEVNAGMGKIVAAPTAGGAGILPGSLSWIQEMFNFSDEKMYEALLVAGTIGRIIASNATISGAEGGCQAECGAATAMSAAAIVELKGGTPEQSLTAASFAMLMVLGLVCDPVAGLVEFPCALRNGSGTINALVASDIALSGVECIVPFDEVVQAMYEVGNALPETLRETALGGCAACPSAKKIECKIFPNRLS
ncbi:MAG: L-serine ammonia-lyase, iron-sulfur-dependent, subunit alpha [Peptoniphilaceae bacterium]|uniref:L-serine ammonia-lyase, iron-sulfur-dependent, subunit alpha n=1 Tax=Parvimonas sp. TaxID=1944660 RepID=UPI0025E4C43B|nr:L-serine ammonia-lyase, iron-sulfur-dependent, subunit alpha [Parvimonas sp.]MCI5997459.1 L-serine ammonia-lyase, iron-sulfur-dependent, subunit alpha [Parvimonas sp.]MDD7764179.1 L-serine ammonia-lyase, iron-sulfur-dependent, subunit alpha [Peptoniphilaceae bacterium]MDY3050384.1 L-serine ammonia-lyase, iron-sulfur-dependent, subunit alpha [Parvimonas sp.]